MFHIFQCLLLICLALSGARTARADEWFMATPYADSSFHTQNIKLFSEEVGSLTGGELTISVHSAGSLFRHPEIKNAVRSGQVQLGEFLLSRLANENPIYQLDSVPFLATDYEQARDLWRASRSAIAKLLSRQGLTVLFSVPWPPQGLFSDRPVEGIADLRGVKFRAYNTATERLAQLLGAVPTQVEIPDIPQAFATGRVEAMMTSPSTGANTRAWDFVDYYYHLQAWLPKNIVVVNERAFRRLSESQRRHILTAAAAAERRGWDMSFDETQDKLDILRGAGLNISPASSGLLSGLFAIGEIMVEEWAAKAGPEGAAILKELGK